MPDEETNEAPDPAVAYCRHCGEANPDAQAGTDFLCRACDGYQDTMACPVCHQPARISLLPDGTAPAPHAPVVRRKR